jgi:hypothetical protein
MQILSLILPMKVSKCTTQQQKPMKITNSESDSDTPDQKPKCSKTIKKRKKKSQKVHTETQSKSRTYALVLSSDDASSNSSKSSGSIVHQLLKQMMLDQKQEAKKHALLVVNLSHQNQLLKQQFEFLADTLEECSKGDSSLSSIASVVSAAWNLSFSSAMTPKLSSHGLNWQMI